MFKKKNDINHDAALLWKQHVWLWRLPPLLGLLALGQPGGGEQPPCKVSVKNMHNPFVFLVSHSSLLVSPFLHPRKAGEGWVPSRQAEPVRSRWGSPACPGWGVCVRLGNGTCSNRAQRKGKRSWGLRARAGIPHPKMVSKENAIASWKPLGFAAVYSSLSSGCLF